MKHASGCSRSDGGLGYGCHRLPEDAAYPTSAAIGSADCFFSPFAVALA